jgi:hypothetical protein
MGVAELDEKEVVLGLGLDEPAASAGKPRGKDRAPNAQQLHEFAPRFRHASPTVARRKHSWRE